MSHIPTSKSDLAASAALITAGSGGSYIQMMNDNVDIFIKYGNATLIILGVVLALYKIRAAHKGGK